MYDKYCKIVCIKLKLNLNLTLLTLHTRPYTFANSIDLDETARDEPSHLDLNCLQSCFFLFLNDTFICNNEHIQIKRQKSLLEKLRGETVKIA